MGRKVTRNGHPLPTAGRTVRRWTMHGTGATRVLVTCSDAGLAGLPPGVAGLLARDGGR